MQKCPRKLSAQLKQPPKQKIFLDLERSGGPVLVDESGKVLMTLKDLIEKF